MKDKFTVLFEDILGGMGFGIPGQPTDVEITEVNPDDLASFENEPDEPEKADDPEQEKHAKKMLHHLRHMSKITRGSQCASLLQPLYYRITKMRELAKKFLPEQPKSETPFGQTPNN